MITRFLSKFTFLALMFSNYSITQGISYSLEKMLALVITLNKLNTELTIPCNLNKGHVIFLFSF